MYYVAYGSNMNLKQMKQRCPNSYVIGNGILNKWKLVFNIHADIIEGGNNDKVPVVVWNINNKDWDSLDYYEGYPTYYIRKNVNVVLNSGEIIEAIAYVMVDERKGICPPNDYYFKTCETGCIENQIDTQHLYEALNYSIENKTKYNQYYKR